MPILKAKDLRDMSDDELRNQLEERKTTLRQLRFQMVTGAVDDVRAIRNARRDVAKIKTVMRERELQAQKEAN